MKRAFFKKETMGRKMKLFSLFALFLFVSIIFISFVSGYGISSYYYSGNPLIMAPGETKEVVFGEFQNMVGDKNITIRVELLGGKEIASIIDSSLDYFVPLGRKDIPVNMRVSIPKNASDGEEHAITIKYYEVNAPSEEGGMVGLSMASQTSIKVLVKKPEELKEGVVGFWWILLIVLIVAIVVVIIVILIIRARKSVKDFENIKRSLGKENEK